jgi:hypothetical protein
MEALRAAILRSDVVSFDVFDTLVTRVVAEPEDVHLIVTESAAADGIDVPPEWPSTRYTAEAFVRSRSTRADVTLDEIYAACAPFVSEKVLSVLRTIEIRVEQQVAMPTRRGLELYRLAVDSGRTVVLSSDMYLPKAAIEAILTQSGYAGWHRLIVSGDDGVSKWKGTTFDLLRADFAGRTLLHIGDNAVSDVERPLAHGVDALRLSPAQQLVSEQHNTFPRDRWERKRVPQHERVSAALVSGVTRTWFERQGQGAGGFAQLGYAVTGPALLGFAEYVHQIAISIGAPRIYFLAREGAILKRAYEAAIPAGTRRETAYALLSTRVTGMASLSVPLDEKSMRFLSKTPDPLTARSFLTRVFGDADENRVDSSLRAAGVDPDELLDQDRALVALRPVFDTWSSELLALATEQRQLLTTYLSDLGMESGTDPILLVDVGWAGTIQNALAPIVGPNVHGAYLGIIDDDRTRSITHLHGWVDARRGGQDRAALDSLFGNLRALEVLLASPDEGSIRAFARLAGEHVHPTPVFLPNEFPPVSGASIAEAQIEALRFIEDFSRARNRLAPADLDLTRSAALAPLLETLDFPTGEQLRELSPTPFDGTYGARPGKVGLWGAPARASAIVENNALVRRLRARLS